jgi:hypothetical protein
MENKKRYASTAYIKSRNVGKYSQTRVVFDCILPIFCGLYNTTGMSPESVYQNGALASTGRI